MFRSNCCLKNVLGLVLGLVLLSTSVPFASAAQARRSSTPLRYAWQEGQVFAYEVEITADRDTYVDTMEGVITYTAKSGSDGQLKIDYSGGLSQKKVKKPGQSSGSRSPRFGPPPFPSMVPPGFFGGPAFRGIGSTSNTITLSSQGVILALEGDSQLPYLLGNLSLLVFEPLPERPQPSWTVTHGVSITSGKGRRSGPPFFRPPGFPGGPFGSNEPDKSKAGSESVSLSIQSDDGHLVTAKRQYQLNTPTTDGESSRISGNGAWTFNRELAVSESLDFSQQLTARDGNTTITVPVKIKYRRLSDPELAKHQEEQKKRLDEAKKRNAEAAEKRAKTPLSAAERKKILDGLRTKEFHGAVHALHKLDRKLPTKADNEVATAVRALTDHENMAIRRLAQEVAKKWPLSADAAPPAQDTPTPSLRTWTDNTGKFKIEAEFVGLADGSVSLRRKDGKEIALPLTRLSPADRKVAEDLAAKADDTSNPFDP
ncbi:MAG: hypothetical protein HQ582_24340 [Planctomycetes bacterium]|nr:hypothetical protein [Planctomycetota bacterium]